MTTRRQILFIDGSQGAAGDMLLGALLDAGADIERVREALRSLGIAPGILTVARIERAGLVGTQAQVSLADDARPARTWTSTRRLLAGGSLDEHVERSAVAVFRRLFEAEAAVHGRSIDDVHLHEAGSVDAVVDIVGCCVALAELAPQLIVASTLTTGHGEIRCAHGLYPVPAPATLELIRGVPVRAGAIEAERLTPTGAALLTATVERWEPMPAMRPVKVGLGAGTRDLSPSPNMLRVILGEPLGDASRADPGRGEVAVLECVVDDATPQALSFVLERVREAGALDAYLVPALMKKGRPGQLICAVARPSREAQVLDALLRYSSTLGCRVRREARVELSRRLVNVATRFGSLPVKLGEREGETWKAWPEYDACAAAARRHGVAIDRVQHAALAALHEPASGGTMNEDRPSPDTTPPAAPAPEKKPEPAAAEPKRISIDRFFQTELRVARVLSVERIENADKLLKLQIDVGEDEPRQLVAGVALAYEPDELVGKRIIVVANLKPARIRGVESQGMLLAADLDGRPIVASFDEEIPPGTRVR